MRGIVEAGINARVWHFELLPPWQVIEAFFGDSLQCLPADPQHKGGIVVNSALELAPPGAQVRAVIAEIFERIESAFLQ
ncbi:MAG: hypothetical protein ACP5P4_06920 [Steroidobacteraceae bacterium]